jgi:hypothetical protein
VDEDGDDARMSRVSTRLGSRTPTDCATPLLPVIGEEEGAGGDGLYAHRRGGEDRPLGMGVEGAQIVLKDHLPDDLRKLVRHAETTQPRAGERLATGAPLAKVSARNDSSAATASGEMCSSMSTRAPEPLRESCVCACAG